MTTGIDVFDTTLQHTNLWLKDLMKRLGTEDRRLAYRGLEQDAACRSGSDRPRERRAPRRTAADAGPRLLL